MIIQKHRLCPEVRLTGQSHGARKAVERRDLVGRPNAGQGFAPIQIGFRSGMRIFGAYPATLLSFLYDARMLLALPIVRNSDQKQIAGIFVQS